MTEYTCDSFRFFNLFPVYFGGKGTVFDCDTQARIVDFLDSKCGKIDDLIFQKQSLIDDLESYKKSLIYEVVTGKRYIR